MKDFKKFFSNLFAIIFLYWFRSISGEVDTTDFYVSGVYIVRGETIKDDTSSESFYRSKLPDAVNFKISILSIQNEEYE